METKELKACALTKMKDKHIGKDGTQEREEYEYELSMDVLGKMIKTARLERNLTQEVLKHGQKIVKQKIVKKDTI